MDRTATYLYCVVKAAAKPGVSRGSAGLPGAARPSVVSLDPSLPAQRAALWLVVAEVPLDRYGPDALESSLRDLQWVGDAAVAHEAVVEHFAGARGATVVPMKLFTMFSSTERAIREMRLRRRDLEPVMKRIAGCEEWGVRMMRQAPAVVRPRREAGSAASGAAFLSAKKRARDEIREAAASAAGAAEATFAALADIARDATRRDDVPEGAAPPLLDAAFLVPTGRRARQDAAAGEDQTSQAAQGVASAAAEDRAAAEACVAQHGGAHHRSV